MVAMQPISRKTSDVAHSMIHAQLVLAEDGAFHVHLTVQNVCMIMNVVMDVAARYISHPGIVMAEITVKAWVAGAVHISDPSTIHALCV